MKLTRALSTLVQKEQGGLYLQLLPFACLLLLAEMHYSQASCVQTEKKKKKKTFVAVLVIYNQSGEPHLA